jgi:hypothetical protein
MAAARKGGRFRRTASATEKGTPMTVLWFVIWLIANNVGGHEPLVFDPVNGWTATLILAIGLDLGRAGGVPSRGG